MQEKQSYEKFPFWIPLLAGALSLTIYGLGLYIFYHLGILFAILYLSYCLWLESQILRGSCKHCYYFGKTCGLGRGKICALIFKKGDPKKFIEREISWKDLIPDFLILIFPLVGGVIVLIKGFSWLILSMMVILVILSMAGNALVRGSLACKYCKQKELGCPAERLFNKNAKMNVA
jgi:hypothetical protein